MNKALPPIAESENELAQRLRQERNPQRKERLQVLFAFKTHKVRSRVEAAQLVGRHRNSITNWLRLYEEGGLTALLHLAPRGRVPGQRTLPPEIFEALKAKLDSPEGFGGYMHVQGWLLGEYGLEVNYDTLRSLLRRSFGAKLKVARPQHVKKTPSRPLPSPPNWA